MVVFFALTFMLKATTSFNYAPPSWEPLIHGTILHMNQRWRGGGQFISKSEYDRRYMYTVYIVKYILNIMRFYTISKICE